MPAGNRTADPIDARTLHRTGTRNRFGARDPRKAPLGAFLRDPAMKKRADDWSRQFGVESHWKNMDEMMTASAGARVIKVFERDPVTGRAGQQLQGTTTISIGGAEVPVESGECVLLQNRLGSTILDDSRREAKALDDWISTCLAGGDNYILYVAPAMYKQMKESNPPCLPSSLASYLPNSDTAQLATFLFGRFCRVHLNRSLWDTHPPGVHSHETKRSKQSPHGETADQRPVVGPPAEGGA